MKKGVAFSLTVVFIGIICASIMAQAQETGRLALDVSPEPAEVLIDGKKYAEGSGVFKLASGDHVVEISKEGYLTEQVKVFIGPDALITKTVTLRSGQTSNSGSTTATGKTFTNSIGMEFVLIPPGAFGMGCNCKDDPFTENNECPKYYTEDQFPYHQVTITQAFYLGKYEVTQEQWYQVMGNNPSEFKTEKAGMNSRNHPVENVSWNDAQEFINKLNQKEGTDAYRLPTEAEWEYAFHAGGDIPEFFDRDNEAWWEERVWVDGKIHPVGQKRPLPSGLYDMLGNVFEWCQDTSASYNETPTDGSAYGNSGDGQEKIVRGGSWDLFALPTSRFSVAPDIRDSNVGFRVVVGVGPDR